MARDGHHFISRNGSTASALVGRHACYVGRPSPHARLPAGLGHEGHIYSQLASCNPKGVMTPAHPGFCTAHRTRPLSRAHTQNNSHGNTSLQLGSLRILEGLYRKSRYVRGKRPSLLDSAAWMCS